MRRNKRLAVILITVALCVAGCAASQQPQMSKEQRIKQGNIQFDKQRILMSTGDLPNPYDKLGDLSYTEPLSPDSIDSTHINERLREMAIARWGRQVDAIIHVTTKVGSGATTMTVTAEGVEVKGDCSFCRHNHASPTMAPTSEMPIPD